MRTLRTFWLVRWVVGLMVASLGMLEALPAFATSYRQEAVNRQRERQWAEARRKASHLPAGVTDTPDAKLRARIAAKERAAIKPAADVRPLGAAEMKSVRGRGPFRSPYFSGTLPWQKSFRDVNLSNGNLFKSFTDVQVAPGRGAGLVLQRTYNSNDARVGPFGVGWTHAYDIRIQEAAAVQAEANNASLDDAIDDVPRTDFFGAKHTYHRDADGLYSPPAYLFDEMDSDYDAFLESGPTKVKSDTEKGMDGTIKHYTSVLTLADGTEGNERACDTITDRHGNVTTLAYDQSYLQADGSTRKLLTSVTDPTGRALTFTWHNFGTSSAPAYRIVECDAPLDPGTGNPVYKVTYEYYTNASDPASYLNLYQVHLDPDGLDRVTTYAYTSYTGGYYDANGQQTATENGLLASVSDKLGHTVYYQYEGPSIDPVSGAYSAPPTNTLWVDQVTEPGGQTSSGSARNAVWTLDISGDLQNFGIEVYVQGPGGGASMEDIRVMNDLSLRTNTVAVEQGDTSGTLESLTYSDYDGANNLLARQAGNGGPPEFGQGQQSLDVFTYGPHGNQLTHRMAYDYDTGTQTFSCFPGTDQTDYFNASKYFAKQTVTDRNGHASAMDYFDSQDTAVGNRGEVAWVRDAGYNDTVSPSYHKEFDYTYNAYGQKLTETNLNGVETDYTYGTSGTDKGNLTQVVQDPGGTGHLNRTSSMHYDVMGRVTQSTDPKGQESDFTYNTLGQPLTVKSYNSSHVLQETITYSYGGNGRTDSVTDARGTTTMTYEAGCDRVASVSDPVTGTTGYTYGLGGERRSVTLPGGGTWTYDYTIPSSYTLNGGREFPCLPGYEPDKLTLLLTGITDDAGRRVDVQMDPAGGLHAVRFDQQYDTAGTTLIGYAEEEMAFDTPPTNGFDSQRRLTGVRTSWHWLDTSGQYSQWRARLVSENDYTYDNAGQRLTNAVAAMTPSSTGAPQYTGGSPTYGSSQTDAFGSSYTPVTNLVQTSRTEQYGYDSVNRLTSVDYGDGETQGYTFDAMGNRTQKTDTVSSTTTTSYAFDNANRLTSAGGNSYTNDADGNTLTGGGRTNTWDSQNRLTQSATSSHTSAFTYGADGLRRSSQVDSGAVTKYAYDGQTMVREMRNNAQGVLTAVATYLTGPRGMEYRRDDGTGAVRWYVYDGTGSVTGELDPSGNLTAGSKYDVYGALRSGGSGTGTTRQGYVGRLGHVTDSETGLVYMRARYYDPAMGRFVSQDPEGDGVNWFIYCSDNPINMVDPTGREGEMSDVLASMGINAILGGLQNGLFELANTKGDVGKAIEAALIGAAAGSISGFGWGGAATAGFATQFFTSLLNGSGAFVALKRALISGGIAGAGSALALKFGDIENAQLTIALISIDADLLVDAAILAKGI